MSATEAWARAKSSGLATNLHPETAKNMGIEDPPPPAPTPQPTPTPAPPTPTPIEIPPRAPEFAGRPDLVRDEQSSWSWGWLIHLIYLLGLGYCIWLLHSPRVVTKTETVEVEKIVEKVVEKPVERVVTKYVDRPVPSKDPLPKVTLVQYVTNCNKYVHAGTCEMVMAELRSAQAKRLEALKRNQPIESTVVL